jgi:hypothetical protein
LSNYDAGVQNKNTKEVPHALIKHHTSQKFFSRFEKRNLYSVYIREVWNVASIASKIRKKVAALESHR